MSLEIKGEKCAVCNAYLFEEDDVVYCPECGAPHHRECYNSLGECGLKQFHGTDNQYKRPEETQKVFESNAESKMVTCGMCGEKYDIDDVCCPSCNAPNISKMGGRVISIDFLGGVPSNTDIGDGVTAEEAKKFVASNTHRYIPKFVKFKQGKKLSWNWLAFFIPCGWLFSRKMYLLGSIIGSLQIAFTLLTLPFVAAANQLDLESAKNSFEMALLILDNVSIVGESVIHLATVGSLLNTLLMVLFALFGDYIYRNRVINSIKDIKASGDDIDTAFRKKGGINFWAAILAYFAVSELPSIIAYAVGLIS